MSRSGGVWRESDSQHLLGTQELPSGGRRLVGRAEQLCPVGTVDMCHRDKECRLQVINQEILRCCTGSATDIRCRTDHRTIGAIRAPMEWCWTVGAGGGSTIRVD